MYEKYFQGNKTKFILLYRDSTLLLTYLLVVYKSVKHFEMRKKKQLHQVATFPVAASFYALSLSPYLNIRVNTSTAAFLTGVPQTMLQMQHLVTKNEMLSQQGTASVASLIRCNTAPPPPLHSCVYK